jgi:hypothetical protein
MGRKHYTAGLAQEHGSNTGDYWPQMCNNSIHRHVAVHLTKYGGSSCGEVLEQRY